MSETPEVWAERFAKLPIREIIETAARLFDEVVVGAGESVTLTLPATE